MIKCSLCEASVANNKWATIKAHDQGWFFGRDGTRYCPEHVPEWVASWREKHR